MEIPPLIQLRPGRTCWHAFVLSPERRKYLSESAQPEQGLLNELTHLVVCKIGCVYLQNRLEYS